MVLVCCNLGFVATSLACSLANTMTKLVIFRALQGASASGLYNLPFVVVMKVVPPKEVSLYTTLIGGVFVVANVLGPALGGVLASAGKWRLMFTMNVPIATLAFVLLLVAGPEKPGPIIDRAKWRSMDWIGGLLSIICIAPMVLALQEGGAEWAWDSAVSQGLLVFGGLCMLMFIWYEIFCLPKRKSLIDPVLPSSMFRVAPIFWLLVNALFIGLTFYGGLTLLPSRLQIVNDLSAGSAGLHLLVMTMTLPLGAFTGAEFSQRFVHGAQWSALAGTTMVLIGTILLVFLPGGLEIPLSAWVAQCHLGIGFGILGAIALFVQKDNVGYNELTSATSIYDMIRAMGGTIGVAICSAISHRSIRNEFTKVLPANDVQSLLASNFGSITELSRDNQRRAREAYGHVFGYQFQALAIAAGFNVLVAMVMVWTRYFVGLSLTRRGDSPYQHWRKEVKETNEDEHEEDAISEDIEADSHAGANYAARNLHESEDDAGANDAGEQRADVTRQGRLPSTGQRKSSAPTLPRLSRFENRSMENV
ncbi:hypothetical protein FKW77_004611 [Venturia effusa]|uniref:Major facilitator superfamily (MFS) profile domain-containing protein n=1 Tax=Venturia effusa TaxID=50376 RepID=A0A517L963_9PEZI|nr:hypothetical protein FKW77_004611 [Venturia effusa]